MTININQPSTTISATTTSARVAYPTVSDFVRVMVEGTTVAHFRSGDSTVVAAAGNGQFLHGNKEAVFRRDRNHTHIAAIMASGTATIHISSVDADELVGF